MAETLKNNNERDAVENPEVGLPAPGEAVDPKIIMDANEARAYEKKVKPLEIKALQREIEADGNQERSYVRRAGRATLEAGKMGAKAGFWSLRAPLAIATDTAWSSLKASWEFIKKMGWGILTLHPPSAGAMWKDIREKFKEDKKENK